VIDDLLVLSYSMIERWQDEAQLLKDGWTPPTDKAVQP
jgi:hypothetical protein